MLSLTTAYYSKNLLDYTIITRDSLLIFFKTCFALLLLNLSCSSKLMWCAATVLFSYHYLICLITVLVFSVLWIDWHHGNQAYDIQYMHACLPTWYLSTPSCFCDSLFIFTVWAILSGKRPTVLLFLSGFNFIAFCLLS